jgi:hypothetical protein
MKLRDFDADDLPAFERTKKHNSGRIFSQHNRRRETCSAKRAYSSQREARRIARLVSGRDKVRHYACPVCGKWHLTSEFYD